MPITDLWAITEKKRNTCNSGHTLLKFLMGKMPNQLRKHSPASVHSALLLCLEAEANRWIRESEFKSFPALDKSINYAISALR